MGQEGVPTIEEYLSDKMPENGVLGFDGVVEEIVQYMEVRSQFQK